MGGTPDLFLGGVGCAARNLRAYLRVKTLRVRLRGRKNAGQPG